MNEIFTHQKVIRDPIHGYIHLDETCADIVDTVQFQRLRFLKQLGSAYFVFPGASHNRFEHSIGVSHLAGSLIDRLGHIQPALDITAIDVKCVKVAGLCHDLGHGPFSHVFDSAFIPRARPGLKWTHEQASEMMLSYLIDENGIDMEKEEVDFTKALIAGDSTGRRGKNFLFDIVANKRNGLDVDKFDYISRDCYNLQEPTGYDCSRLMNYCAVMEDQICFYHKEVYNLYELFNTRYSLFKRIYTHRVGKAIEYMIVDAMLAADPYLGISSCIDSGEEYLRLTDCIIKEIELSKQEELKPARSIIKRIYQRQLYKFVDEFLVPPDSLTTFTKEKINSEEIVSWHKKHLSKRNVENLKEEDVIVDWLRNDYGAKGRNPIDSVLFFNKERVSLLVPEHFSETVIRVFSRDCTLVPQIQLAFRGLLSEFSSVYRDSPLSKVSSREDGHKIPTSWCSPKKRRYQSDIDVAVSGDEK